MEITMISQNADRDSFMTLKRWLENRNKNRTFIDFFHEYKYKNVAIYGAGDLGRLLYDEIKDSDIRVLYFVDRNAEGIGAVEGVPVITIRDIPFQEKVDVLVITPVGNYDEINKILIQSVPQLPTLSLREAVYEF